MFSSTSSPNACFPVRKGLIMAVAVAGFALASPSVAQSVSAVPSSVKSDFNITSTWYAKYVDAGGIPVLGSKNVSDAALLKARRNALSLLATMPTSSVARLRAQKVRIVIVATSETVRNIPEYAAMFPSTAGDAGYWGGFGATTSLPIASGTERNLITNASWEENVFVHEFGHTVGEMALPSIDPKFSSDLTAAWNNAVSKNLWAGTYARKDKGEYYAEGVQSYFNVNREGTASDTSHNTINTRAELKTYDPMLYNLLYRVYGAPLLQN